jgi:hypothetical protein
LGHFGLVSVVSRASKGRGGSVLFSATAAGAGWPARSNIKQAAEVSGAHKIQRGEDEMTAASGSGVRGDPWLLKTPSGQSEFTAFRDEAADPPALVVQVGKTELRYRLRCLDDLAVMLKARGDWVALGSADEQKSAAADTVEAWARSGDNPVGGWYGLKKGLRGRFANYVPPVMEALGLAEVEHNAKNNRMRARPPV